MKVAALTVVVFVLLCCLPGGAFAAGASFDAVTTGLANHSGVPGRMQARAIANDVLLIDDSYNANPQSMQSALETLARLETSGLRLAVLGEMGELGGEREKAHREAGRLAGSLELDGLYLLGPSAEWVAEGARESGMTATRIHVENDHESIVRNLRKDITKGDRILIKGSRSARMERIAQALEEELSIVTTDKVFASYGVKRTW